jgi:hypothetical protein
MIVYDHKTKEYMLLKKLGGYKQSEHGILAATEK